MRATAKKVAKKAAKKKVASKLPREIRISKKTEVQKVVIETPLNLKITAELNSYGMTDVSVSRVDEKKHLYVCTSFENQLEEVICLKDAEFEDLVLATRALREENRKNQLLLKAK